MQTKYQRRLISRRKLIIEELSKHETATSRKLSEGTGLTMNQVSTCIRRLAAQGVVREVYRIKESIVWKIESHHRVEQSLIQDTHVSDWMPNVWREFSAFINLNALRGCED